MSDSKMAGRFALLAMCSMVLNGCVQETTSPGNSGAKNAANTLWFGGPIVTMDKDQPRVEAVVSDSSGRVVFAGSLATAREQFPESKSHNLDGHTMMAGFIEQHLHPFLAALSLSIPVVAPEAWEIPGKTPTIYSGLGVTTTFFTAI